MKLYFLLFLLIFYKIQVSAQCTSPAQVLDWTNVTWNQGQLTNTYTVNTTALTFNVYDPANALLVSTQTLSGISMPVAGPFYQGGTGAYQGALLIAGELTDLTTTDSITTAFSLSSPKSYVQFTLFDVDANTPVDASTDRQEVIKVYGYLNGVPVSPTLTGHSANTVSGNIATGLAESPSSGTSSGNGNLDVTFGSQFVDSVVIEFSTINIVGAISTNAEPGYALYDISFCDDASVLPIQLINFNGNIQSEKVSLQWQVSNEFNIENYTIEHSNNGLNWKSFYQTNAYNNNSEKIVDYNYFSTLPEGVNHYFRLKITEPNQTVYYSKIIYLKSNKHNSLHAYPNPVNNGWILVELNPNIAFNVYDLNGKDCTLLVNIEMIGLNKIKLNTTSLNSGIYYLNQGTSHISFQVL
jgi:hypothetical protein